RAESPRRRAAGILTRSAGWLFAAGAASTGSIQGPGCDARYRSRYSRSIDPCERADPGHSARGRPGIMSSMADFLPWQRELASAWLAETERFAHAWLIHGLPGIGKRSFALAAARALLCEQKRGGTACGECQACRWMAAGNHPDFRRVRPDAVAQAEGEINEETAASAKSSPSKEIRIEQVRNLAGWFGTATHRGGWRVAVIYPAHAMNLYTANALLKVLEEPPSNTVFLLTADAPDRLLPTIVSRCRRLPLAIPSEETAVHWLADLGVETPHAWLAAAGGAPLRALQSAKE